MKNKRGFSLVEMIIYLAILATTTVLIVNGIVTLTRTYDVFRLSRYVGNSGALALGRMTYEVRQANSINIGQSTFGVTPGVLTLNTTANDGSATTVQFYVNNGILRVKIGGVDQGPITLSNVTVTNFTVTQIQNSLSQGVVVQMTLQAVLGSKTQSETFYTTAVLRNIY